MAIHYEHDLVIERPVEEVYAYLSDVGNAPEWMPWADETTVIEGPKPSGIATGQQRSIKQTDFGLQSETVLEATDVDPIRGYSFRSVEGPVEFQGSYRFEPVDRGTRLTRTYHVEIPGLLRLIEPIVARRMKRRWEADLERVKAILNDRGD